MNDNFDMTGDDIPDNTADGTGEPASGDRIPTNRRPLGFWLRAVDALLTREFDAAFHAEGVTRGDWMLLNALAGDVDSVPGERPARRPKRLRNLERRGWAEEKGDGTWVLTDEGRAAKERLGAVVDGIRARVSGSVSTEDFATTLAALETIARELGWEETTPRAGFGRGGFGRGGFGPGFGPGLRPGFGPGLRPGFGPGFRPGFGGDFEHAGHGADPDWHRCHDQHSHGHHGHRDAERGHHGHGHGWGWGRDEGDHHEAQRAYERGFTRGFAEASQRPQAS